MYLSILELKTNKYAYILDQITEGDDTIIDTAIEVAIEEVKGYLMPNFKHEFNDGRLVYDVEAIFAATGTDRNALILSLTKTVTIWHVVDLCNADIIYEQTKERYDRALETLKMILDGKMTIGSLPQVDPAVTDPSGENNQPFRFGSRPKFNYE
ncbi:phage protein Gp36 family protein [Brumimicrobium mesophilum]|uniref:phage protein Gp36 family protein n=1 Tax=Brumimicrobium mesophilum TaxID=392717 RepID=UPI000D143A32|nr:phage protein Gp36 family protein [Brumimicrobium mesophilum]